MNTYLNGRSLISKAGLKLPAILAMVLASAGAVRGANPEALILSPECPVWADVSNPVQFVIEGVDADDDLAYCDMGVNGPLVDQKYFSSTNSGTTCSFTYTFTTAGTNLVWFQVFDRQHNPSAGAHCTVMVIKSPVNQTLRVLTYNTHLFEDSPLECITRCGGVYDLSHYYDNDRKTQIAPKIRSSGADIVALEEVWAYSWRNWFRANLGDVYPYSYTFDSGRDCEPGLWDYNLALPPCITSLAIVNLPNSDDYARRLHTEGNGLLLLSKYPLSELGFSRFPTYTQGGIPDAQDTWADKGILTATADVQGEPLRLGVSHALTGPDDYYGSWTMNYRTATVTTFRGADGQAYLFGVDGDNDLGHVSRFEDYSYADEQGIVHHAAGWKEVYSQSMDYGCAAATAFELNGATYLFGLHGSGTNAAIIRRINDDPATGWSTVCMKPLSVNYKCLTSFELNGERYMFMIYPPENNAYLLKLNADATGWTSTHQALSADFVNFTPFEVNGHPYLLGVHANNNAYVYGVKDDGTLTNLTHLAWSSDWVPTGYELDGQPYMFLQSPNSTTAHIRQVTGFDPADWVETPVAGWPNNYVAVKSFQMEGHPHLFGLRNCCSGALDSTEVRYQPRQALLWRLNGDGQGVERLLQLEDIRMIRDATLADQAGPPAIIMGDFNVHPNKYGAMNEVFRKAHASDAYVQVHGSDAGGETICATNVLVSYFSPGSTEYDRLDYVYFKPMGQGLLLEPTGAYVTRNWRLATPPAHNEDLSDHYPLFAEFRLQETCQLAVTPGGGGQWQLRVTGRIGRNCEIQYSSDLRTWEHLSELRLNESPQLYTDPTPTTTAARFYRVRLLP